MTHDVEQFYKDDSDTPRTDALLEEHHDDNHPGMPEGALQSLRLQYMIEHARELERQLAEAQGKAERQRWDEQEIQELLDYLRRSDAKQNQEIADLIESLSAQLSDLTKMIGDAELDKKVLGAEVKRWAKRAEQAEQRMAELERQILYLMREGIEEHWQSTYCPIEGDPAEWTDKDVLEAVAGSLAMFGKSYDAAMEGKC